ncbi:hypothetical protein MCOR27_004201 [Pyricularia oryzae]|uniref:tRNA pseudouridine(55) synthase n=1 Tax=Pyricularia grisea TaxID=148305 RepID=A0ABQ8NGI5_PYRGI|nr:hypothetical protein MCOR01_002012 [Pyricularia oryzae]KAI6296726.1 hypothetical protein MCOR33_006771 [Pyricularia grisea]KAI6254498.1 hypothetical protein MCOR19_008979 [Pyricularia oryzae]KAI6267433.1 hypothetical protein MCOR26_009705 [Pyricularia oryzae]KAI6281508.1 hypothetical protein MCOR27_004201 [Pyricularia oryzae]
MKRSLWKLADMVIPSVTGLDGIFAINKPMGMSSAQVIRDCQAYFQPSRLFAPMLAREAEEARRDAATQGKHNRKWKKRKQDPRVKMGHGGTLDPLATGVLILGVGRATKSLQNFLECTKTYETIVVFGAATDTYDRVGRILAKKSYDEITRDKVEKQLDAFRGKYKQMPPLYSALKMNGKPLYEYAREGKPIPREIETREVEVLGLELLEWYEPGTHNHRWPTEEAGIAEKSLAESVWRVEHEQATGKKLTPEQGAEEDRAFAAHQSFKEQAEERQDKLVFERGQKRKAEESNGRPNKKQQGKQGREQLMSGALGELPPGGPSKGRGSDLVPPAPSADTPPPWDGKGPPACKIRMTVTSGFYVRSFAHELGEKVGSAALMAELVRNRQGDFVLEGDNCLEYDDLVKGEDAWGPKLEKVLHQWSSTHLQGVGPLKSVYAEEPKTTAVNQEGPSGTAADEKPATDEKPAAASVEESQTKESGVKAEETKPTDTNGETIDGYEEWNGFSD